MTSGLPTIPTAINGDHLDIAKELCESAHYGRQDTIKQLLGESNPSPLVNFKDQWGYTALMHAAKEGHLAICQVLIDKGASLNLQNIAGDTALIWATTRGHKEVVKLLLGKGAEAAIANSLSLTALDYAKVRVHADKSNALLVAVSDVKRDMCDKARESDLELVSLVESKMK